MPDRDDHDAVIRALPRRAPIDDAEARLRALEARVDWLTTAVQRQIAAEVEANGGLMPDWVPEPAKGSSHE